MSKPSVLINLSDGACLILDKNWFVSNEFFPNVTMCLLNIEILGKNEKSIGQLGIIQSGAKYGLILIETCEFLLEIEYTHLFVCPNGLVVVDKQTERGKRSGLYSLLERKFIMDF